MTDWKKAEDDARNLPYTQSPEAIARIVHSLGVAAVGMDELQAKVDGLERKLAAFMDTSGLERRQAALAMAREFVAALPSEQRNDRGYRDHAMKADERIAEELRVARYLLEQE